MFFTSTFCGSLFCGSAVHILDDVIADSEMLSADQRDLVQRSCSPFQEQIKAGSSGPGFFTLRFRGEAGRSDFVHLLQEGEGVRCNSWVLRQVMAKPV